MKSIFPCYYDILIPYIIYLVNMVSKLPPQDLVICSKLLKSFTIVVAYQPERQDRL